MPKDLLTLMYYNDYKVYAGLLQEFLRDAEEVALKEFFQALHPGSVRDSLGLLLLLRSFDVVGAHEMDRVGIHFVLAARIPQDPFEAYWRGYQDHR
jgi:hypothetical protein